ncbi:MAG: site-specific integrase [Planctomycetes bacterium]|nr:site-specific integrase [Planctomycetota bacterium]MCG2683557.1 site-specific integrase [Planctomycetales bacterium]
MSATTVSAVPKYRHHKGTGQAFIQVKGRRHYLGKWNTPKSKEHYAAFVAELVVNPVCAPVRPSALTTVVELIEAYWTFAVGYYTKGGQPTSTLDGIRQSLHLLRSLYGTTPANEFGPVALKAVRGQMLGSGRLNRTTINKRIDIIRRMFKWAVAEEIVAPAVYQGLQAVAGLRKGRTEARESKPVLPVADDLVEATLPYLPAVLADMVRFQRLTGARPGELFQLRPCDVDRSDEVWEYRPADHKTAYRGRERIVYIGPKAQQVLLPYLLRDAQANCFSPVESEQKRHEEQRKRRLTRVQPSQRNRRKARPKKAPRTAYTKDSYQRAIARAVVKANRERTEAAADMGVEPILLPHWHANQLRHSKATEIRRQFGLEAAQVSLGHAKADVTQIYAERDSRLAVEVARKIG